MGKAKKYGALKRGIEAYRKVLERDGFDGEIVDDADAGGILAAPGGVEMPNAALKLTRGGESRLRRVAKFLVLVGKDEAARVLAELDMNLVEALSREIVTIQGVPAEEAGEILEEFQELFATASGWTGTAKGGVEEARKLLYVAFGREKGEAYLRNVIPHGGENPFGFLESFSGGQIAALLRAEAPATRTMVLSWLPPKLAADTLKNMMPGEKAGIVKRLARLEKPSPGVVDRVAAGLREKARHFADAGGEVDHEIDGMGALTAILKQADVSFGENLLAGMGRDDPGLAREIQEKLYTLDDVVEAEDRPLQEKLRDMDDRSIALLLKGRSGAFTEKILSNVSENRQEAVREEGAWLGEVYRRDAGAEGQKFLEWFRRAREKGEIVLYTDGDVVR